jgi:glycosyltransferase involved in cell wall biosynthesis
MTETDLVTVIMPNRNHARYLQRSLDAMLVQTWTKLQIIVVDDASTDTSLDVVASYAKRDSRVRSLALKEHHGINRAVNAALGIVQGEFVYVAGADDFVEPIFFERCVTEMNRNPEAGLCFSDPIHFREPDQRTIRFPLYLSERPAYFDPAALTELFRRNYFHISANTGLYRTEAFRQAGGYQPELHWLSDWFVTLVVALRQGACYLPEQLTYVTVRGDSYSARSLRDGNAQRPLLEQVLRLLALPAYADVALSMQRAGLLPEYHPRSLVALLKSAEGRKFIKPQLILRILSRYMWSFLRPFMPVQWRRRLRHVQSVTSRSPR